MKKIIKNSLAEKIRSARITAHLSQLELGKGLGVSDKAISSYEQGRSQPSLDQLKQIAQTTRMPVAYFTEEQNLDTEIANRLAKVEDELSQIRQLLEQNKTRS